MIVPSKVEGGLLHNEDAEQQHFMNVSEHRNSFHNFDWAGQNGECRDPVTLKPGEHGKT